VPAPPAHGQVQPIVAGGFRRGTFWEGRTQYAVRANGERAVLRYWNSRAGTYRTTRNFNAYFDQNRQQFLVEVGCKAYVLPRGAARAGGGPAAADNIDAAGNAGDAPCVPQYTVGPDGQASQRTAVIPLDPDERAERLEAARAFQDLDGVGLVRDRDHSQADIEEALRNSIPGLLRSLPLLNTTDGLLHKVAMESDCIWC